MSSAAPNNNDSAASNPQRSTTTPLQQQQAERATSIDSAAFFEEQDDYDGMDDFALSDKSGGGKHSSKSKNKNDGVYSSKHVRLKEQQQKSLAKTTKSAKK